MNPYRDRERAEKELPLDTAALVKRVDLTAGPHWTPATVDAYVTAATPTGFLVRGNTKPVWSWSGVAAQLGIGNLALRVTARAEAESAATVTIWFRDFKVGATRLGYGLVVQPQLRRFRLVRYAGGETEPVLDWAESALINGLSERNTIEVRSRDDRIAAVANGDLLSLVHDGSFGRGDVLIGVAGGSTSDAMLIESFEVWSVR